LLGKTFFGGKLKIFQHVSYENYLGSVYALPEFIASTPAPQPSGPAFFGPVNSTRPDRSWLLYLDGKYSLGPFSLVYALPFGAIHPQLTFANAVVQNDRFDIYDRYVVLQYQGQLARRLRLDVKGYYIQFVRSFSIELFPPSYFFPPPPAASGGGPGGLHF